MTFTIDNDLVIFEKSPIKPPIKSWKNSGEKADVIKQRMTKTLEILVANPSISRMQLANLLQITESQTRTILSKLRKIGRIERIGSNKNGKWNVKE